MLLSHFFCVSCVYICFFNWPSFYSECVAHHSHSKHTVYVSGCVMSLIIKIILIIIGVCVYYRLICFVEVRVL